MWSMKNVSPRQNAPVVRGHSLDHLPTATNPKGKYSAAVPPYPRAIKEMLSMRTIYRWRLCCYHDRSESSSACTSASMKQLRMSA